MCFYSVTIISVDPQIGRDKAEQGPLSLPAGGPIRTLSCDITGYFQGSPQVTLPLCCILAASWEFKETKVQESFRRVEPSGRGLIPQPPVSSSEPSHLSWAALQSLFDNPQRWGWSKVAASAFALHPQTPTHTHTPASFHSWWFKPGWHCGGVHTTQHDVLCRHFQSRYCGPDYVTDWPTSFCQRGGISDEPLCTLNHVLSWKKKKKPRRTWHGNRLLNHSLGQLVTTEVSVKLLAEKRKRVMISGERLGCWVFQM